MEIKIIKDNISINEVRLMANDSFTERWHKMSLVQQMGNIGSEVQRAFSSQKRGDEEQKEKSVDRFLELIDLSLEDKRWQKRSLEICRAREVLCDYFFAKNSFGNSFENLINYFNAFALKVN